MPHTYASVAEADDYAVDGGATKFATQSASFVAAKLAGLESVSRLIDEKMERSAFGSGFGPRIGTNRYDGNGGTRLRLRDDLLTVTSITLRRSTAAAATETPVADTDYYLLNGGGMYSPPPYRTLLLHGQGTITTFGTGYRVTDIAGTWGERDETRALTPTVAEAVDLTETDIDVSALTGLSAGLTLKLDSEQVYVRSTTDAVTDFVTVVRGANGSTAATHSSGIAIARYVYHPQVFEVCLRLYRGRWRARDGGADGTADDLIGGMTSPREGEDTIIRRGLYGLRMKEMI